MPEVQNAFARTQDSYAEGQPTDSRFESNSAIVQNSGGVAFGKPVFRGTVANSLTKAQTLVAAGSEKAGNTGTGTVTDAPAVTASAKIGRHTLVLLETSATGEFTVTDPDGLIIGNGNIATEFVGGGLTFTWANGGTMTVGDSAYIDVTGNDLLGISLRDKTRPATDLDTIPRYAPCGYMERGSIAVRTAAAAAKDAQVYWDATADRFTDVSGAGKLKLKNWLFETGIGAAGLTPIRRV